MTRRLLTLIGVAVVASGWGSAAPGGIVSIHPSQDNSIYADKDANSNALGSLFAGDAGSLTGGSPRRALLQFDIAASIPAGSVINSVSLGLTLIKTRDLGTSDFELHALSKSWGEGTSIGSGSGAAATTGDATWTFSHYNTVLWAVTGGDFGATSGTAAIGNAIGPYTVGSQPGLVADVQHWLDSPASNFGWVLKGSNESVSFTAREFGSKENLTQTSRPTLTVDFTPVLSGPAAWLSSTSGTWSVGPNWSTGTAPNGAGQTAVLNKATNSALAVILDSPETVGTLQFGNSGGNLAVGYTVSGASALTFDNSGSASLVSVSEGTHAISAPIVLDGNLDMSPSAGSTLTISGNMGQGAGSSSLTLRNSGTLILSGSNDYVGGTVISAGTLHVTNPLAITDGTSLTVGASGALVFASAGAEIPVIPPPSAMSAVPEPSSFVLLGAGAVALLGIARRRSARVAFRAMARRIVTVASG
jgi:autotransporter-associated beta strand protein